MKFWIFTILLGLIALANSCGGDVPSGGAAATDATAMRAFRPVGLPPGEPLLPGCEAALMFDAQPNDEPGFWTVYGTVAVANDQALVRVENHTRRAAINTNVTADRVFVFDGMPASDGDVIAVNYKVDFACTSTPVCRRVMGSVSVPERCP